jgi:hypothetical protein
MEIPKIQYFKNIKFYFVRGSNCHNDIGHELKNDNYMTYLPLYIVTRNMYSTTRKLISRVEINRPKLWREVITKE